MSELPEQTALPWLQAKYFERKGRVKHNIVTFRGKAALDDEDVRPALVGDEELHAFLIDAGLPVAETRSRLCQLGWIAVREQRTSGGQIVARFYQILAAVEAVASPERASPPTSDDYSQPQKLDHWATVFNVTKNTVSRWFKTRQVKALKRGNSWCVAISELPKK